MGEYQDLKLNLIASVPFVALHYSWPHSPLNPICLHCFPLGMDKTVTTPLDMGAGGPGQQRFVVAYTLKQGAEKQPDILSAQKGSTSSTLSLKDSLLCSPAAIRPDGLLLHNNSRNNYVSDRVCVGGRQSLST